MNLDELRTYKPQILAIAAKHGASNIRVFGSVARGEADTESDVDFLLTLEKGRTLLDLSGLRLDLMDLLHLEVDVVTEGGVKRYLRAHIHEEAKPL